jgi:hypothetical protein
LAKAILRSENRNACEHSAIHAIVPRVGMRHLPARLEESFQPDGPCLLAVQKLPTRKDYAAREAWPP